MWNDGTTLQHHGILGQKWGVRRYQNPDGSYTSLGKSRKNSSKRIFGKDQALQVVNKFGNRSISKSDKRKITNGAIAASIILGSIGAIYSSKLPEIDDKKFYTYMGILTAIDLAILAADKKKNT